MLFKEGLLRPKEQQYVMQTRFSDSSVRARGSFSGNLLIRPVRSTNATTQTKPLLIGPTPGSHINHQEAQVTPPLATNVTTNINESHVMTKSATLLLIILILPLIALFIYNLIQKLWSKFRCPSFPSNDQKSEQIEQHQSGNKKKPAKNTLVMVVSNVLTRPRVQLMNRFKRQFVDEEFAANQKETSPKEVTSIATAPSSFVVNQDGFTVEKRLSNNTPDDTETKDATSMDEVAEKKEVKSVIEEEQQLESPSLEQEKQYNEPVLGACYVCGQVSQELQERCQSHSPRISRLSSSSKSELVSRYSVSPIMLNCQPEIDGCGCRLLKSGRRQQQHHKLASRRLMKQSTNKHQRERCLRLFYEDYYDDEPQEEETYRRLEFELGNSRGLQESAQELMQLNESERCLFRGGNVDKDSKQISSTLRAGRGGHGQETVASSMQLHPNGSDGEFASSISTSLGGSDSGFGACKPGSLCVSCQGATSEAASPLSHLDSATAAKSVERASTTVKHKSPLQSSAPSRVVEKRSSAEKWRRNHRQEIDQHWALGLDGGAYKGARRMSVAGDQMRGYSSIKDTSRFRTNIPQISKRSTRRPSDTYLYGAGVEDNFNKSTYSSSGGSSSGIGVSGSACTNTPTASAFPYSSFLYSDSPPKISTNLMTAHPLYQPTNLYHNNTAVVTNLLTQQHDDCSNSGASRKFSLPVQLEWQASERLSPKCTRLLFDRNFQQHQQSFVSEQLTEDLGSTSIASNLMRPEENRRSSQTITRQSSFWLADQSDDSILSLANIEAPLVGEIEEPFRQQVLNSTSVDQPAPEPAIAEPGTRSARASLGSIAVLSGDSIDSVKRRPLINTSDKCSSMSQQHPAKEKEAQSTGENKPLSARNSSSTTNSNSNASSPTPPDSGKHADRLSGNRTSGFMKRHKLKTKRHQRSEDGASKRRRAFNLRAGVHQHSAPSASIRTKDEEWDEDDDDLDIQATIDMMQDNCPFGPMQSTCSLPQHMPKAGTNSYEGGSNLKLSSRSTTKTDKKDSATLERQCRELWKLRATLHDDSCFSDNWANYHQRLSRRYDSGYKSIEHQFSSSFEGPIRSNISSHQANGTPAEAQRPPSSCSNQQPTTTNEIENKMSHLELAEDQKDTSSTCKDVRNCHSRSSKCSSSSSSSSSNEDENNKM